MKLGRSRIKPSYDLGAIRIGEASTVPVSSPVMDVSHFRPLELSSSVLVNTAAVIIYQLSVIRKERQLCKIPAAGNIAPSIFPRGIGDGASDEGFGSGKLGGACRLRWQLLSPIRQRLRCLVWPGTQRRVVGPSPLSSCWRIDWVSCATLNSFK